MISTMEKICTEPECEKAARSRSLCVMHYARFRRSGQMHALPKQTEKERFWSKVKKQGDCWIWDSARDPNGYGRFSRGGRSGGMQLAHRVALEYKEGVPANDASTHVLHSCDTPSCVNPDHLRYGSHSDNMSDMIRRERTSKAKLTASDVREMRRLRTAGATYADLAKRFTVSIGNVYMIISRTTWKHVE